MIFGSLTTHTHHRYGARNPDLRCTQIQPQQSVAISAGRRRGGKGADNGNGGRGQKPEGMHTVTRIPILYHLTTSIFGIVPSFMVMVGAACSNSADDGNGG